MLSTKNFNSSVIMNLFKKIHSSENEFFIQFHNYNVRWGECFRKSGFQIISSVVWTQTHRVSHCIVLCRSLRPKEFFTSNYAGRAFEIDLFSHLKKKKIACSHSGNESLNLTCAYYSFQLRNVIYHKIDFFFLSILETIANVWAIGLTVPNWVSY